MNLDKLLNGVLESRSYYIYAVRYNDSSIDSVLMVQGFENLPDYLKFKARCKLDIHINVCSRQTVVSLLKRKALMYTVLYSKESKKWTIGDKVGPYGDDFITTDGNHTTKDNLGKIETF